MASKKKNELSVVQNFRFVSRWDGMDEETMAEIAEELESLGPNAGISCRMIKVPGSGGLAYEVEGEDKDDVKYMKEIQCVILYNHLLNAYWPMAYGIGKEDKDKIPVCSSMDGKTGVNVSTGEYRQCDYCPENQFGTAVDKNGAPASGKACKNMRRIYLMMSGDPNIYLLTVPPTSLKDVKEQLDKALIKARLPLWKQVVKLSLVRVQNRAGTDYSKIVLTLCGILPPDAAETSKAMRTEISRQYQDTIVTLDEYNAPKQIAPGTVPAIPGAPNSSPAPDAAPLPDDSAATPVFEDVSSADENGDLPC